MLQCDSAGKPLYLISTVIDITERNQAEEALRASESQFRELWEATVEGIVILDMGIIVEVNDAICRMFGYTREQCVGKSLLHFAPPDVHDSVRKRVTSEVEGRFETSGLRADGEKIVLEAFAKHILYRGKPMRVVAVRDITGRKKAEEHLRESEDKYRNLFNNAEVGMFRTRLDGSEVLEFNEKYLKTLHCTREELEGKPSQDMWAHKGERERMVKILAAEGHVADYEFDLLNKQGEVRRCVTSLRLYRDTGILEGSIQDITERKRVEAALRASEVRYRRLFEAARDGILILDAETGMVVDVNPYLIGMLGYSYEQFKGKAIWELGMLKDVIANQEKFLELRQQGYVRYDDLPLETAEGQRMHVEFVSNVYLVDQIKVIQCNIRNITERRLIEEKLRTSEVSYRRLFEAARDGILILDADTGMVLNVNPFLVELLGYSAEQFLGKAIWELGLFKDIAANKSHFAQLQQKEFVQYEDVPLETATGKSISVEFVSHVYQVGGQKVIQCNIRDITERMQAEKKVLRQLEELRRWQEVTLGREDRIRQLKHEVDELLARLGEPVRYPSAESG